MKFGRGNGGEAKSLELQPGSIGAPVGRMDCHTRYGGLSRQASMRSVTTRGRSRRRTSMGATPL